LRCSDIDNAITALEIGKAKQSDLDTATMATTALETSKANQTDLDTANDAITALETSNANQTDLDLTTPSPPSKPARRIKPISIC
jgi:hypothetical protein